MKIFIGMINLFIFLCLITTSSFSKNCTISILNNYSKKIYFLNQTISAQKIKSFSVPCNSSVGVSVKLGDGSLGTAPLKTTLKANTNVSFPESFVAKYPVCNCPQGAKHKTGVETWSPFGSSCQLTKCKS